MLIPNLFGIVWFIMGAGWGYWFYRQLVRRYGSRVLGRLAANAALMTGYFAGLGGLFVLWNGGAGGGEWSRGSYVHPYKWQWSGALAFALIGGPVAGALLAWLRQSRSYGFDIPSSTRFIDEEEMRDILEAESDAGPEKCRHFAESLLKQSRLRQQPLQPELEAFVRRHLPGRLTSR